MRRSISTLVLVLGSAALAQRRPTASIALPTFSDTSSALLASRLENELVATDSFQVLESRNQKAILEEQGFQQSGACDTTDCAVKIGQLLSVERIVQARLSPSGMSWELSAKLLDVGTGQILLSHVLEIHGGREDALQGGAREMASILSGRKQPKTSRTVLEARRPLWPWITAGGLVLAGGGAGIWYLNQKSSGSAPPSSYQVQLDWSSSP